MTP
ncbi:hypothetical protein YPPY01_1167, partial [Yersinia pestis PY-01]|jgi:hypothetical protein